MRQSRWLFQTLIFSVTINLAFVAIFFYLIIRDNPLHFSYAPSETIYVETPPVSPAFLGRLHTFSFEHLSNLLLDSRKIDHGYCMRDFALAALATYYDFDVERGLERGKLSKKIWNFEGKSLLFFPGLEERDFEKLNVFSMQDKWPLTTKGLYKRLQEEGVEHADQELLEFFCSRPEFRVLQTLLARASVPIKTGTVLLLALEIGWEKIDRFFLETQKRADFSDNMRRHFLLEGIRDHAKTAAYLLILTDAEFVRRELKDADIENILALLLTQTKETKEFAIEIQRSWRSDQTKNKASELLSAYSCDGEEIAGKFYEKPGLKELRPVFREQPPAAPPPSLHIIQPGESLWGIAKKYGIPIEVLMEQNHLQSTLIQPGKTLKIPSGS